MMPYDNREVVLRLAVADIGLALGDAVWAEVNPALRGKAWCGAWVLSKLRQAGLTNATWTMGSGFVAKLRLPLTTKPQPADIAYWDQPRQHFALVESLDPLVTLDGNSTGGVVRRKTHLSGHVPLFYSIAKLADRS